MNSVRRELDAIIENMALERLEKQRNRAIAKRRLKKLKRQRCIYRIVQILKLDTILFKSDRNGFFRK